MHTRRAQAKRPRRVALPVRQHRDGRGRSSARNRNLHSVRFGRALGWIFSRDTRTSSSHPPPLFAPVFQVLEIETFIARVPWNGHLIVSQGSFVYSQGGWVIYNMLEKIELRHA